MIKFKRRRRSRRPSVYWQPGRGIWASIPLPFGFRLGHGFRRRKR